MLGALNIQLSAQYFYSRSKFLLEDADTNTPLAKGSKSGHTNPKVGVAVNTDVGGAHQSPALLTSAALVDAAMGGGLRIII